MPRFALVAGEASGDILGAALIRGLRARYPDATFYGVAGPRMREAGCEAIESIDALSIMGLVEVLKHLPRLLKLRRTLVDRFAADKPDAFIGIDAPDFNRRVERDLRSRGIKTVHVNSTTIWAWRPGRIHGIARAVVLMLCLYPFEPALYEKIGCCAELRKGAKGDPSPSNTCWIARARSNERPRLPPGFVLATLSVCPSRKMVSISCHPRL